MDPNKLTEKSQEALRAAQSLAARLSNQQVDAEHLLVALLEQENGIAATVLLKSGVKLENLHRRLMGDLDKLPKVQVSSGAGGAMFATQRLEKVLADAEQEGRRLKDEYVSVEHLLLALLNANGAVGQALKEAGLTREKLETAVKDVSVRLPPCRTGAGGSTRARLCRTIQPRCESKACKPHAYSRDSKNAPHLE